jgi:hypothetical protein
MSLNAIATPAAREPGPLVTRCRGRTVAKVDSIVIWSALIENGFDLPVCVLDGVVDTAGIRRRMSVSTARSLLNCDVLPVGRRVEVARCRGVRRGCRRVGGAAAGSRRRVRGCGGWRFRGDVAGSRRWRAAGSRAMARSVRRLADVVVCLPEGVGAGAALWAWRRLASSASSAARARRRLSSLSLARAAFSAAARAWLAAVVLIRFPWPRWRRGGAGCGGRPGHGGGSGWIPSTSARCSAPSSARRPVLHRKWMGLDVCG